MQALITQGEELGGDISRFNYDHIDHADTLRQTARRLEAHAQETAVLLWEMGALLAGAKKLLASYGNGTFQSWMVQEAGVKLSMGYRLLHVHAAFQRESLEEAHIAVSALYALAKPSTPDEARAEALQRARGGEIITNSMAQGIISTYRPPAPELPPLPELPPSPTLPPLPEYSAFEREELLPQLHDAGNPDAPQMLSGVEGELRVASTGQKEEAEEGMRASIAEVIRGLPPGDEEALEGGVTEILDILGLSSGNIALAAQFGHALASGPATLSDLTELSIKACGKRASQFTRAEYLAQRRRVLRLIDSLTYAGCGLFEHKMRNGQLVFGLIDTSP